MSLMAPGHRCNYCGEPYERALRARDRNCEHAPDCQLNGEEPRVTVTRDDTTKPLVRPKERACTMPHPAILTYTPATGRALIVYSEHPCCESWMSVDDVYDQMFAWFDLARELRGRNLAVEAVEAATPRHLDSGGVLEFNVAPDVVFEPEAPHDRHR